MGAFRSYKSTPRTGAFRMVGAQLPRDHAKALRGYASRNGVPIQSVIQALVADWVKLNELLNNQPSPAASGQPAPLEHVPTRHTRRADTGKSEPAEVLQGIDRNRRAGGGQGFKD